jgi:hypothetical protein
MEPQITSIQPRRSPRILGSINIVKILVSGSPK